MSDAVSQVGMKKWRNLRRKPRHYCCYWHGGDAVDRDGSHDGPGVPGSCLQAKSAPITAAIYSTVKRTVECGIGLTIAIPVVIPAAAVVASVVAI